MKKDLAMWQNGLSRRKFSLLVVYILFFILYDFDHTKTGSIITGTAATIVESISPFIAMTGIGIPIAFALYTCSIGLKIIEDNKDLAANIEECKEFLLQWLIMCNNNLVVYDKYENLAIPYYGEKIKEEEMEEQV